MTKKCGWPGFHEPNARPTEVPRIYVDATGVHANAGAIAFWPSGVLSGARPPMTLIPQLQKTAGGCDSQICVSVLDKDSIYRLNGCRGRSSLAREARKTCLRL
jgi:hypothetical protein